MTTEAFRGASYLDMPLSEMEAAVARFHNRLDAAQAASPATKEWVRDAVHRRGDGRCPVRIKRLSHDIILRYGDGLADLFCEFPDHCIPVIPYDITIGYQPPGKSPRVDDLEVMTREAEWEDEWGIRWGHAAGGVGATPTDCPIKEWSQLEDYLANRMPDPRAPGRLSSALPVVKAHGSTKYCFGIVHLALFERLHSLRGMENLFCDLYEREQEVHMLAAALLGYLRELVRGWAEVGVDAVFFTDDWGSQTGLMIAPEMWRRMFKPYYRTLFDEVHRVGLDAIFHSCGNVTEIVEDLIEVGVDVLDPIQPGSMKVDELARRFGGRISFSGGVNVQQLMVSGTPRDVKIEIRRLLDTLGRPFGGGLCIGPANVMTPDVPLKNIRALFEATHER